MPANELFLEAEPQGEHRLRLDFFKLGDRYGHRLSVVLQDADGGRTLVPLAESVEGNPDDPWPPSPPLQSLSIETLPDDRSAALMVGMAGRSHWSASLETNDFDHRWLKCDFACRCDVVPERIGSEYQAMPGVAVEIGKGCAKLCEPGKRVCAMFVWFALTQPIEAVALPCGPTSRFRMTPTARPDKVAGTIRWQYSIVLPSPNVREAIAEEWGLAD